MSHKAVFLDRDGVINEERKDYVKNIEEFKIFEGVAQAISLLKKNNFLVIIITNQSAINRNLLSHQMLEKIHNYLHNYLRNNGTSIDGIYYCPHKPDEGCDCRKPKSGLLLKASQEFDINLHASWMIGDCEKDIEAAKTVGCNWILLKKDQSLLKTVRILLKNTEGENVKER